MKYYPHTSVVAKNTYTRVSNSPHNIEYFREESTIRNYDEIFFVTSVIKKEKDNYLTLLEKGVNINANTILGTPLVCAARNDDQDFCQSLLAAGADVNLSTLNGSETALMMSARNGNVGLCKLFLTAGASTAAVSSLGSLREYINMCKKNSVEIYDLFFSKNIYPEVYKSIDILSVTLSDVVSRDNILIIAQYWGNKPEESIADLKEFSLPFASASLIAEIPVETDEYCGACCIT